MFQYLITFNTQISMYRIVFEINTHFETLNFFLKFNDKIKTTFIHCKF